MLKQVIFRIQEKSRKTCISHLYYLRRKIVVYTNRNIFFFFVPNTWIYQEATPGRTILSQNICITKKNF